MLNSLVITDFLTRLGISSVRSRFWIPHH